MQTLGDASDGIALVECSLSNHLVMKTLNRDKTLRYLSIQFEISPFKYLQLVENYIFKVFHMSLSDKEYLPWSAPFPYYPSNVKEMRKLFSEILEKKKMLKVFE